MHQEVSIYYTIYKITNLVNGKYYIGKHQTSNLNDGYMGSGKLLKSAIRKYGIDNFIKEILEVYDTEAKMNLAERILVVANIETNYNLCSGGQGGWGYINKNNLTNLELAGKHGGVWNYSIKQRSIYGSRGALINKEKIIIRNKASKGIHKSTHQLLTPEAILKKKETMRIKEHQKGEKNSQFGRPRSIETKRKISETYTRKKQLNFIH